MCTLYCRNFSNCPLSQKTKKVTSQFLFSTYTKTRKKRGHNFSLSKNYVIASKYCAQRRHKNNLLLFFQYLVPEISQLPVFIGTSNHLRFFILMWGSDPASLFYWFVYVFVHLQVYKGKKTFFSTSTVNCWLTTYKLTYQYICQNDRRRKYFIVGLLKF
jgi:hypothetical protein